MKYFICVLLVFAFYTNCLAQTTKADSLTKHQFLFYKGRMAFSNTRAIPNGLSGDVNSIVYFFEKRSIAKNHTFLFNLRYDFGDLQNNFISKNAAMYKFQEFNLQGSFLWPIKMSQNCFSAKIGSGVSGHTELFQPTKLAEEFLFSLESIGNWIVSANGLLNITYKWNNLRVHNYLNIPVVVCGFFPDYQYFPSVLNQKPVSYIRSPNVISYFGRYRRFDFGLKFDLLSSKVMYSIGYVFLYNSYEINGNSQRYMQNMIGVGIGF